MYILFRVDDGQSMKSVDEMTDESVIDEINH